MVKFIHSLQIIVMIAVLAVSFFISYGFFITHISFEKELFLGATIAVFFLAFVKFVLKFQIFLFIRKHKSRAEFTEKIKPEGKKRLLTYDALVWFFMLALALFQTKLFGISDIITQAYFFALFMDVVFWIVFQSKFQSALISGQVMIFCSRPQSVSLKNIRKHEVRFEDYYINYRTGKFALLKSDLLSAKAEEKINASF